MRTIFILNLAFYFSTHVAFAEGNSLSTNNTSSNTLNSSTSSNTLKNNPNESAAHQAAVAPQPQGNSVKGASSDASKRNMGGAVVAQVASMGFMMAAMKKWGECSQQNYPACAQAAALTGFSVVAGMQSGSNASAGGSASDTSYSVDGYGFNSNSKSTDTAAEKIMGAEDYKSAQAAMNALKSPKGYMGAKLENGKLTTPDGKSYNISDFSSPAAMAKAGFSDEDIKGAMGKAKRLEAEALKKLPSALAALSEEEGPGGGTATATPTAAIPNLPSEMEHSAGGSSLESTEHIERNLAGLSKNYNGDPIGVSQNNIFQMMTQRYRLKEKQDSFVNEEALLRK